MHAVSSLPCSPGITVFLLQALPWRNWGGLFKTKNWIISHWLSHFGKTHTHSLLSAVCMALPKSIPAFLCDPFPASFCLEHSVLVPFIFLLFKGTEFIPEPGSLYLFFLFFLEGSSSGLQIPSKALSSRLMPMHHPYWNTFLTTLLSQQPPTFISLNLLLCFASWYLSLFEILVIYIFMYLLSVPPAWVTML